MMVGVITRTVRWVNHDRLVGFRRCSLKFSLPQLRWHNEIPNDMITASYFI